MDHIILFDEWCKKCVHKEVKDTEEPCDECLSNPINHDSRRPVMLELKEEGRS